MMLGGGCGEQIARWIINGRPDKYMFNYDIRRFDLFQFYTLLIYNNIFNFTFIS